MNPPDGNAKLPVSFFGQVGFGLFAILFGDFVGKNGHNVACVLDYIRGQQCSDLAIANGKQIGIAISTFFAISILLGTSIGKDRSGHVKSVAAALVTLFASVFYVVFETVVDDGTFRTDHLGSILTIWSILVAIFLFPLIFLGGRRDYWRRVHGVYSRTIVTALVATIIGLAMQAALEFCWHGFTRIAGPPERFILAPAATVAIGGIFGSLIADPYIAPDEWRDEPGSARMLWKAVLCAGAALTAILVAIFDYYPDRHSEPWLEVLPLPPLIAAAVAHVALALPGVYLMLLVVRTDGRGTGRKVVGAAAMAALVGGVLSLPFGMAMLSAPRALEVPVMLDFFDLAMFVSSHALTAAVVISVPFVAAAFRRLIEPFR